MKRLAIVTYSKGTAEKYFDTFQQLLQNKVQIKKYSVCDGSVQECIEADLVIISAFDMYKLVRKYIPESIPAVIANLTFTRNSFQQIHNLPSGTKALMVNTNMNMALQCIDQLYQLGIKGIELIPYSPSEDDISDIEVAVTPGEEQNVPSTVKKIINTGQRVIDISTIAYVLSYFEVEELFNTMEMRAYIREIIPLNFTYGINRLQPSFSLYDPEFADYRSGIIGFAQNGIIFYYNQTAEKILGQKLQDEVGRHILSLFPQPSIQEAIKNSKPLQKKQIKINGIDVLVKISNGTAGATSVCYLSIERVHEPAIKMPSFKGQAVGRGYVAKYSFNDIITRNENMKRLKKIADMNADSDSSVLITGESGTGKELFAQGIHNASRRKDNPFIAINCAAVPENLIESELFGYEEGAFTGARRGGKMGLFELAHSGTLFLDEIGEMPVHLQARLLRVLQEKEVTRIGGDKLIGIDVRIIAATNRNLADLIKSGQFRKDLYYRLNVIPLKIPPLRERKEDIPLLIKAFKEKLRTDFEIAERAMARLEQHDWEGNIRELCNYVEYFRNLRKAVIDLEDLPTLSEEEAVTQSFSRQEKEDIERYLRNTKHRIQGIVFVLEALRSMELTGGQYGRRSLAELSRIKHEKMSEMEIRSLLLELEEQQMVKILKGRGGTVITEYGMRALELIKTS